MGKKINLLGQRFGRLLVIDEAPSRNGQAYWICQCDCGTIKEIRGSHLRNGKIVSCGCKGKEVLNKPIDLTGQKFGRLTPRENAGKDPNHGNLWLCDCECGNTTIASTAELRNGTRKSCGCINKERFQKLGQLNAIDISGQKFGKLLVLERSPNKNNRTYWKCQCDCGNIIEVQTNALTTGNTTSCGCSRGLDLTNQQFGNLIAKKKLNEKDISGSYYWLCLCKCGRETKVSASLLNTGKTQSCKYCQSSKGEIQISNLLENNNIKYQREKTFNTCISPITNAKLRFDFYLIDKNILIEYDGEQHFSYKDNDINTWNNKENFDKLKYNDNFKNQWCKDNNIPLIRIPYWHLKDLKLEDLLLETSEYII